MLIIILSHSLGDNIAAIPVIEKYQKDNQIEVYVKIKYDYIFLFEKSYPTLKFVKEDESSDFSTVIELDYTSLQVSLQKNYAKQLGYDEWEYIRPKIVVDRKERPKLGKYVAISVHST